MKRPLFLVLLLGLAMVASLGAQSLQATVKEFSGKVEVKPPNGDWQAVAANMVIDQGSTLSTGFNSRLVLMIGQSQLIVKPLTRLLLDELVKRESTNVTGLTLKVGKVNASVKSPTGEKTEFTVKDRPPRPPCAARSSTTTGTRSRLPRAWSSSSTSWLRPGRSERQHQPDGRLRLPVFRRVWAHPGLQRWKPWRRHRNRQQQPSGRSDRRVRGDG